MEISNILMPGFYLQHEKSYSTTCLPKTTSKAKLSKYKLKQSLSRFPEEWPFMDNVRSFHTTQK
jgi:hypothetical protein